MDPEQEMGPAGQTKTDQEIEDIAKWGSIALILVFFMVPAIIGMVIFAVLRMLQRETISIYLTGAGLIILAYQGISGKILSYLAVFKGMNVSFITEVIDNLSGRPLEMNFQAYLSIIALSMVFSFLFHIFAKYFWKNPVKSKQEETQNKKESGKYKSFKKNRLKFLTKQQIKYRQSDSKEVFLGYTDFKERVEVPEKEFNYHMLAVGGTGTGKTTLIGSVMEGALRKDKPIIFVDGKGERASMMDFKKFAEAYGKKVYMFSEYESFTYNPMKYGTPTEIRDKIMNLFEWSEPYYKTFSSRYLQNVVRLIDAAGLERDLEEVHKLLSAQGIKTAFEKSVIEVEVKEPVYEEVKKEAVVNSGDDPLAAMEAEEEEEPEQKFVGYKTVTKKELSSDVAVLKGTFDEIFEDDDAERNLNGLRNQLGELLESDLGHMFKSSEKEIDLRKITDESNVVIFSISGNRYRDYIKKLGKIIILDVNSLVAYRQENGRKSTLAIYDEFSAYGNGEIVDIVNKSRSAGFECIISTQTLADIEAVEPYLTSRILSNCNILATGRVNDSDDAERLAKQFSTFQDSEITSQIERKHNLKKVTSERGTVKTIEAFIAHPKEIKSLEIGEVFLSRKMVKEASGDNYTRRVYVRNALDPEGIKSGGDK